MFGIADWIASLSDGSSLWLVVLAALLLGLRHATDPDHLAAVTTLVASTRERATRTSAWLRIASGAGHAVTPYAYAARRLRDRTRPRDGRERRRRRADRRLRRVCVAVRARARRPRGLHHRVDDDRLDRVRAHAREPARARRV